VSEIVKWRPSEAEEGRTVAYATVVVSYWTESRDGRRLYWAKEREVVSAPQPRDQTFAARRAVEDDVVVQAESLEDQLVQTRHDWTPPEAFDVEVMGPVAAQRVTPPEVAAERIRGLRERLTQIGRKLPGEGPEYAEQRVDELRSYAGAPADKDERAKWLRDRAKARGAGMEITETQG
jgi:hypothetical protein